MLGECSGEYQYVQDNWKLETLINRERNVTVKVRFSTPCVYNTKQNWTSTVLFQVIIVYTHQYGDLDYKVWFSVRTESMLDSAATLFLVFVILV